MLTAQRLRPTAHTVASLSAIDNEFEYVGTHLLEKGFKNADEVEEVQIEGMVLSGKNDYPILLSPINGQGCASIGKSLKLRGTHN